MGQIANITVKKADGTTDQVWTAKQGASGDKSPAIWRNESKGSAPRNHPEMRLMSYPNGDGSVRRLKGSCDWKELATVDGVETIVNKDYFNFEVACSQSMASADVEEFAAQCTQMVQKAIKEAVLADGFAQY